jgi:hypothetical protein
MDDKAKIRAVFEKMDNLMKMVEEHEHEHEDIEDDINNDEHVNDSHEDIVDEMIDSLNTNQVVIVRNWEILAVSLNIAVIAILIAYLSLYT